MVANSPGDPPNALSDFLQPHSMMTPGLLGALAMLGTNSFCTKFPRLDGAIVCLFLSCLFGLAAVIKDGPVFQRIVFYLLNSVIIFSVAAGANTVGQSTQTPANVSSGTEKHGYLFTSALAAPSESAKPDAQIAQSETFFKNWFGQSSAAIGRIEGDVGKNVGGPGSESDWYVIAGSYDNKLEAENHAEEINKKFRGKYRAAVKDALKSKFPYAVVLSYHEGSGLSLSEALDLKGRADIDHVAPDTFLWRSAAK